MNLRVKGVWRKGAAAITRKEIKDSLNKQLKLQGKTSEFYEDLVNDYVYYWDLKKKLITDIKNKGIRYQTKNGNGMLVEKANESVINLQKTTATMLKILSDLHLKEPIFESNPDQGYL